MQISTAKVQKLIRDNKQYFWLAIPLVLLVVWQIVQGRAHAVQDPERGMNLWQLLLSGGVMMVFIGALSVITVSLIIYFYQTLKPEVLVPAAFRDDILTKLAAKKFAVVRELCQSHDNLVAKTVLAGLERFDRGSDSVREAVEIAAKNETTRYWEKLSYLADLAAVAPLAGLLGTVFGMIQSFHTIAAQSSVVKPMLLAGGVAKAFVNTAGGLGVAIPALLFYAFFRSKLSHITGTVEALASDIVDTFAVLEKKR